jgi:hypothetical protein
MMTSGGAWSGFSAVPFKVIFQDKFDNLGITAQIPIGQHAHTLGLCSYVAHMG